MANLKETKWDLSGDTEIGMDLPVTDGKLRVHSYKHFLQEGKLVISLQIAEADGKWRHRRRVEISTTDDPNVKKNDVINAVEAAYPNAVKHTGQGNGAK